MPINKLPINGLDRLGLSEAAAAMIDASVDTLTKAQQEQEVETMQKEMEADLRRRLEAKAKEENKPMVYMLKADYHKLDPALIQQKEEQAHCIIIPVEQADIDRLRQDAVPYTMPPTMPKVPEIFMHDAPTIGKIGGNKTPKILPKDYAKKKKAKRKMQKQSRRKR